MQGCVRCVTIDSPSIISTHTLVLHCSLWRPVNPQRHCTDCNVQFRAKMVTNYPYPWQFLPCSTFNMYPLHPDSLASSESSESSSCMAKKRKRTLWSEAEDKILIDLCKKSREALKGNGISQKGNEIAGKWLSEEVSTFSSFNMWTRCRDKWHNLFNSFTKAKDSSTKTEGDTTKRKYFKHFESYCALNIKNIYLPTQSSWSVYQLIIFPSWSND